MVGGSGDETPRDKDSRGQESAREPQLDPSKAQLDPSKAQLDQQKKSTPARRPRKSSRPPKQSWWERRRARKEQEQERRRAARKLADDRNFELQQQLIKKGVISPQSADLIAELNDGTTRNRFLLHYGGPGLLLALSLLIIMVAAWWAKSQHIDVAPVLGALGVAIAGVLGGALGWTRLMKRIQLGSDSAEGNRPETKADGKGPPGDDQN